MKKILFTIVTIVTCFYFSQAQSIDWQYLNANKKKQSDINLVKSTDKEIVVNFVQNSFGLKKVLTQKGDANVLIQHKGASIKKKGAPDLSKLTQSVIIPDQGKMAIEIIKSDFIEFKNIEIAPSKGVITRDIDPQTVPYVYGDEYTKNNFFPAEIAYVDEPYIIRDYRGQTLVIQPYQYNPVTKVLRVYNDLTVRLYPTGEKGVNTITRDKSYRATDNVFEPVYKRHFLNYNESAKYTPLSENGGKMLIISYGSFTDEMQPFVDWKNSIGIETEIVNYSTIGSSSALKTYVSNYYNNNGLTFLLIVGDHPQVPTSSTSAGDSDNNYGYIAGNDHYLDIFVGRFSAENATQVTTMVNRTLYYERDMSSSAANIYKGVGIASNEGGSGGDMGETDEQHMNNIETDLENYGYTITRCYQNGGSTSQLSSLINNGTGIINYVGHGSDLSWYAPSFSVSNVNALTNTNKYPFIISVACVVGNFKSQTCFAESWIRASYNGTPTGGLVFCGSTINQSWASPMRAQDEMNDLLVANTFKTYGGVFVNGMFEMIDAYGTDGANMADTWTCFGDPSVQTRTPGHPDGPNPGPGCDVPTNLSVSNITETSATLNWGAVGDAQSYTVAYKAQSASTWIESNVSGTSKNVSGLNEGTVYEFKVKTNCPSGSSAYSASKNFTTGGNPPIEYCPSQGSDYSYEWIAGVAVGTFSNNSQAAGYTDFTSQTLTLAAGNNYDVTLTPGFSSSSYNEYWKIWIDLNKDGDFSDAGEELFSNNGSAAVSGSITIPAGTAAVAGTRMRVTMRYNNAPAACAATFDYGEVEDYTVNITGSEPDTEPPSTPRNLTASNITSSSVTLSWSASTDNVGVDHYIVYRDGNSLGNTASTSYNVTGLSASTAYSFTVKAVDAAENVSPASAALNVTTDDVVITYCTSSGNNQSYEWISRVQIGNVNKSSNASGYTDFTSNVISTNAGSSLGVTLTPGFASSAYNEYWKVWIDFNIDGDFEDAGEQVFSNSGSSAVSGTIAIPSSAQGNTRVRVKMSYNSISSPCGTFTYGEVEDYTINIARSRNSVESEEPLADISVYPVPASNYITVRISDNKKLGKINIYSMNGTVVKSLEVQDNNKTIDISELSSGAYFITVENNQEVIRTKFIKQ